MSADRLHQARHPSPAAGGRRPPRALPPADTTLHRLCAEIAGERRRRRREALDRTCYRRLVQRMDAVIVLCEHAHMNGLKETPTRLWAACAAVLDDTAEVVGDAGDEDAVRTVRAQVGRPRPMITDVMDAIWISQEVVFDLMLPWRRALGDGADLAPSDVATQCQDSAA
jgi:hypothetical protein